MSDLTPVMEVNPRRFASPHPAFAHAKVEPIHQPLYSAHAWNAAALPRDNMFFTYAIGGTVAGAGAGAISATSMHTNMEQGGALAMPKLFLVEGIRHVVPLISATLAGVTASFQAASTAAISDFDDMLELIYGLVFVLHVGTKDYVRTRLVNVPGNVGLGGVASTTTSGTTALSAKPPSGVLCGAHTAGKYFGMPTYGILIPSQQTFNVNLTAPQAAPPTPAIARLSYVVLDGILGRETQ